MPAGLGLSDPLPTGTNPSIEGWGRDALAVMDAAGCDRAVILASAGGAMPALWLSATHPERVTSLVIVNGTARVGHAEDYGFGASDEEVAAGSGIEGSMTEDGIPRDIAIFAPSLAHRVGFREWWGRAARRGASPATAMAFNLVTFSADVRWCLPSITCPTLVFARLDSYANLSEHGRYLSEHITGARLITTTGPDILPWAGEFDSIVDEMEEFVTGRAACMPPRACSPPCSSPTLWTRPCAPPRRATASGAPSSTSSTSTSGGSWPATTAPS